MRGVVLTGVIIVLAANLAVAPVLAKGLPPKDVACDAVDKSVAGWEACLSSRGTGVHDAELFYAGYWLARSGDYAKALTYLRSATNPDARILTYIGFSVRKLGDVTKSLAHYHRALTLDPNYAVARAYLGEAYLALDDPAAARKQLAEIGVRCGETCAEHTELAAHIAAYARR